MWPFPSDIYTLSGQRPRPPTVTMVASQKPERYIEGPLRVGAIVFMALAFVVCFLYFEVTITERTYPAQWPRQFRILMALFAASAGVAVLSRRTAQTLLAIIVELIVYGLVAVAQGPWTDINILLLLCFSIQLCLVVPTALIPAVGLILVTIPVLPFKPYHFFDVLYAPAGIADGLVFVVVAVTLFGALFATRVYYDRAEKSREAAETLNDTVHRLTSANVQFQEYAATAENRSMIEERNRLSSELHDAVGYTLTNIIMLAQASQDLLSTDIVRSRQMLESARVQAEEGLAETRRALRALRESEAPRVSMPQKIQKLVAAFSASTDVTVKLEYGNLPQRLPPDVEAALYRTIQEGLTNAFRHGKATEVMILFWRDDSRVQVTVDDNGRGFTSVTEGIGIKGMRQRIEPLGGAVRLERGTRGARLCAWVPTSGAKEQDGNNTYLAG